MAYFDVNNETELPDFELLPPGDYTVMVAHASEETTRNGDGKYVGIELEVVGGVEGGRKLFSNFNIVNPSPKAVEIGRSDFAKFLRACGKPVINTPEEVQGSTLKVTVGVKKRKDNGENQNVVKKYTAVNAPLTANQKQSLTQAELEGVF